MLTFYAVVLIVLVVETFAALMFGLSAEMERAITRRQASWDRGATRAYIDLALRVALRFVLGILLAIRIIQLTG